MVVTYDRDYTDFFHSPGIEPWITGFLKNIGPQKVVLDAGCGLGQTALILRSYLKMYDYIVGFDISPDRIEKTKKLDLFDDLLVADACNPPFRKAAFDLLLSMEVVNFLPNNVLPALENTVKEGKHIVLTFAYSPEGVSAKDLIKKGYNVYRYFLRGLLIVNLKDRKILLSHETSSLKVIRFIFLIFLPLLRLSGKLTNGYLLLFK